MAIKKNKKQAAQKVVKKQKPIKVVLDSKAARQAASAVMNTVKGEYIATVGRRKVSTARVRLYTKAGDFLVNGLPVGQYFAGVANASYNYNKIFVLTNTLGKYAVTVKVAGGGVSGQLGAMVHGLARAFVKMNPDYRDLLKEAGLLTRDDRMKETRKVGTGGKARRQRQSPKR